MASPISSRQGTTAAASKKNYFQDPDFKKLKKIILTALFIFACMSFAVIQGAFFVLGVVLGALFPQKMQVLAERVHVLWQKERGKFVAMTTLTACIAYPITFMTSSFLTGSLLSQKVFNQKLLQLP